MKITINIEKEHYPIEYEIDAYGQRSKTEYSEDEVVINIQENKIQLWSLISKQI